MSEDNIYARVFLHPGWYDQADDMDLVAAVTPERREDGGVCLDVRNGSRGPNLEIILSREAARRLAEAMLGDVDRPATPDSGPIKAGRE